MYRSLTLLTLFFKEKYGIIKTVFFSVFGIGLIAHGYAFFNLLFSHDSLLIYQNDLEWTNQIVYGRYFTPLYLMIRRDLYPPTLVGFLGLCSISVAAFLIIDMLKIKKKITQIFVCGILVTYLTVTLIIGTYIHDFDIYMLALMLATFGAYIIRKFPRWKWLAILPLWISLGLYQSYIGVSLGLLIFLALYDLLEGKDAKTVFMDCVAYFIIFLIVAILYVIGAKFANSIIGETTVPIDQYNRIDTVFGTVSISLNKIWNQGYRYLYRYFRFPFTAHSTLSFIATFVVALLAVIFNLNKFKQFQMKEFVLFFLLLFLLPLFINLTWIMDTKYVHQLMIYPFSLVFIMLLKLLEDKCDAHRALSLVVIACYSILIFDNALYSNRLYEMKHLIAIRSEMLINRIVMRIESDPDYIPGVTEVAFIGDINNSELLGDNNINISGLIGTSYKTVNSQQNLRSYLWNTMNLSINLTPVNENIILKDLPEIKEMQPYPSEDCMKYIDGRLIFKLSNTK